MSKDEIKDIHGLMTQLREKSIDKTIPCYLDTESNMMVIYIGTDISRYEIHHGKEDGTHRDTYRGVILARALAKTEGNNLDRVIIRSPNELTDGNILSLDLATKSDRLVLNYKVQTVDEEMDNFLKDLGIISIKDYAMYLKDIRSSGEYSHLSIQELLSKLAGREVPMDEIVKFIPTTFDHFFRHSYYNENVDNAIFSTGIFTGQTDQRYNRDNFDSNKNNSRMAYETYAELLNQRESAAVSVIVFEQFNDHSDTIPNYLFVVSSNHQDAHNFYKKYSRRGDIGFIKAKAVGEFDAALSINIANIAETNLERDVLPLHLSITGMGSRKTAISEYISQNFVEDVDGLKRLIKNFNSKYSFAVGGSELLTLDSTLF